MGLHYKTCLLALKENIRVGWTRLLVKHSISNFSKQIISFYPPYPANLQYPLFLNSCNYKYDCKRLKALLFYSDQQVFSHSRDAAIFAAESVTKIFLKQFDLVGFGFGAKIGVEGSGMADTDSGSLLLLSRLKMKD